MQEFLKKNRATFQKNSHLTKADIKKKEDKNNKGEELYFVTLENKGIGNSYIGTSTFKFLEDSKVISNDKQNIEQDLINQGDYVKEQDRITMLISKKNIVELVEKIKKSEKKKSCLGI